jgi:tetratricopeptide (TPR) repeat protein
MEQFGRDSNLYVQWYAGMLYERIGLAEEAERTWRAGVDMIDVLLQDYPDNGRMLATQAGFLAFLGEREAFLSIEQRAIEAYRDNGYYLVVLAVANARLGRTERAIEQLRSALKLGETHNYWWVFKLASLYPLESEEFDHVMQEYEAAGRRLRALY